MVSSRQNQFYNVIEEEKQSELSVITDEDAQLTKNNKSRNNPDLSEKTDPSLEFIHKGKKEAQDEDKSDEVNQKEIEQRTKSISHLMKLKAKLTKKK